MTHPLWLKIPSIPTRKRGFRASGGDSFFSPGANNPKARGEQSDPRTAENAPRNQSFIQFIGRKRVYPLSPLLGGGFLKEGGDACSTVNSFCPGGGCAAHGEVSQWSWLSTFSRRPASFGTPGANNPLARGDNPSPGLRKTRPKTNHLTAPASRRGCAR